MNETAFIGAMAIMFSIGALVGLSIHDPEILANSPELRQCLSQPGTTWQGGECVIILNK